MLGSRKTLDECLSTFRGEVSVLIGVLAFTLTALAVSASATAASKPRIDSPRIEHLWADVQGGDSEATTRFWQESIGRTPLVEFVPPQNAGFFKATFLWRGTPQTVSVALQGGPPAPEGKKDLQHLPGTDVWYWTEQLPMDSRFGYSFVVREQLAGASSAASREETDPLNPTTFEGDSVAELPLAPTQHWLEPLSGVDKGTITAYNLYSRILGEERPLSVYTPANYRSVGPTYRLLVIFDGDKYLTSIPTSTILDNMVAKQSSRPVIVVFIPGNLKDTMGRPTRTRDLTCNRDFADYIVDEIVPWVRKKYRVSRLPADVAVAGESLGGLQATYVAFLRPDVFGTVISFSGSYFYFRGWPSFEATVSTQTGWLIHEFAATRRRRLKLYLATGTFEGEGVKENRRMRDVLTAKGYTFAYKEYNGGHERLNWRGILPEALLWWNRSSARP